MKPISAESTDFLLQLNVQKIVRVFKLILFVFQCENIKMR